MSDKVSLPIENDILRLLGFSPVTLIITVGKDGSVNAAPYGWITVVDYNPPQLLFSVNIKRTLTETYWKLKNLL
jgi:flavin reductase (DIM6/NTAB) family NADH-FMN oxidoreductase RutF